MDFQQSRTYINLQNAYRLELETTGKYLIYGEKARRDVFIEIGNVFDTTAHYERIHAETFLRVLNNGEIPSTLDNLLEATQGEISAGNDIYREYSRIATEEGYDDIASLFNGIANIELNHTLTFQTLASEIQNNEVFCKPEEVLWICESCGNILSGVCAPERCPICGFPQGFYRVY